MAREFDKLAKLLRKKRLDCEMTQSQIANELNIHSQFVSNWERGICAPPSHAMNDLINMLKINRRQVIEAMVEDSRRNIEAKILKTRAK